MKKFLNSLHHYFIPRHTNNYNAKLLHHDLLTVYLLIALLVTIGINHAQKNSDILGYATDVTINKLYELTNTERSTYKLQPLKYNEKLSEAARKKAANMFEKNYWAHYGPSGETPWEFILSSGYQYEYAGENLAKNFLFSDDIVQAWMDSPSHKENIVREEYTDVGYAVVNGVLNGEETTLVVQMFGTPLYADAAAANPTDSQEVITEETEKIPSQVREPQVLSDNSQSNNFFPVYFNVNIIFFSVLLFALLLDFYFAAKLNIIRVKGKNLVHMLFLGFIVIGAYILIKGSIS